MRSIVAFVVSTLALGGVASAQAPSAMEKGYAEVVAQSAFGNVTSQSFGGEVGVTVHGDVQIFAEGGRVRDVSTSDIGASAQSIALILAQTSSGITFSVKEPAAFGLAGVRYLIPTNSTLQPYVLAGGGVARVTRDVRFAVNGTDVTSSLQQHGVVLGSDSLGRRDRSHAYAGRRRGLAGVATARRGRPVPIRPDLHVEPGAQRESGGHRARRALLIRPS